MARSTKCRECSGTGKDPVMVALNALSAVAPERCCRCDGSGVEPVPMFSGAGIDQCPNPECVAPHDVRTVAGGSAGEMECLGCRARFWVGEGKAYMPEIEWPGSSDDLRGEVAT